MIKVTQDKARLEAKNKARQAKVSHLKFIYSEKATRFCEIFILLLTVATYNKSKVKISQKFMAFSEYMNFKEYHIRGVGTSKNLGEGGILKTRFKGKNPNEMMVKVTDTEPDLRPKIRPERQR